MSLYPAWMRLPVIGMLALLVAPAGCNVWSGAVHNQSDRPAAEHLAPDADGEDAPVLEREHVEIPSAELTPPMRDYVVGPDDVLVVNVFENPQLGTPRVEAERSLGSRVDGEGRIQLPLIDEARVSGMTLSEIRAHLNETYGEFVIEPSVVVEVIEHRSQPIYLVGEFMEDRVIYMDRPTNVMQALAHGGGLTEEADLRGAHVQRGDRVLPVDIYRMLREGDMSQNIWLEPDDAIHVPDNREQRVYIFGSVAEPGQVRMVHDRLTLAQALPVVGGVDRTGAATDQVRIIRSHSPTRGELLVVDYDATMEGRAIDFPLQAGDVVFVPRTPLGTWNDALTEMLPTLQAVGSTLQPFVQLRLLLDRN